MPRVEILLDQIQNQETDQRGVAGQWIMGPKHSDFYNQMFPHHNDQSGGKWHPRVKSEHGQRILIYFCRVQGIRGKNWFVLPEFSEEFENQYRQAVQMN